jgi:thioesterase domain-containing protein
LGGDSLLAIRLMLGVEEITNQQLEVSTFLINPTFAGLCEAVKARMARTEFEPVLAIRKQGTRPPLFCLYGHTGDIEVYFNLAAAIGDDQPVIGIRSPALENLSRLPQSMEAAAAEVIRLIRKIQPHGAPALVGYSWAGLLAFEVARQLAKSEGIQCYTALIGTTAPMRPTNLFSRLTHFARYLPPWLWHLATDAENRRQRLLRWREMLRGTHQNLAEAHLPVEEMVPSPTLVSQHMLGLMEKYQPALGAGLTIHIFRERDSYKVQAHPLHAWQTSHLPDGGWRRWTGRQPLIYWLDGDHWTIVKPPIVASLAQAIRAAMDQFLKPSATKPTPTQSVLPVMFPVSIGYLFQQLTDLAVLSVI